jgi:potassium efflux system protein
VLRRVRVWGDVSVASVLLGAALLLLTILGAKNIPGLLEIALLQRLPIGAAARYAVTTLSRYVIVIAGLVAAFGAVGIGWDKVQWLAAAITFGLGFGLQEIFANFVSGLILLFDRPIRIGDVVTVGDVTGTVTRIRIRATTIMDGDRKEMIIPNRQFITGSVVNWTLTDPTIRVAVRVGVNYGTDIHAVKTLLVQAARANPLVLPDPAPAAMFTNFGADSLEFELSFFVARVADAGAARDQVNTAIDASFRAAGIEIAFPQRDIHLRATEPIEIVATRRAGQTAASRPARG